MLRKNAGTYSMATCTSARSRSAAAFPMIRIRGAGVVASILVRSRACTRARAAQIRGGSVAHETRTMWGWAADRDHIPMNFLAAVTKIGGQDKAHERDLPP